MSDRGYLHLLTHLARNNTPLPLPTLQASIAHYLAHVQPSPTPLAGSVASSLFFRPISYPKLDALQTAFRHAVHFKVKLLQEESSGLFTRGVPARVGDWVKDVMRGLEGGDATLRLACTGGLLLGLGDWERELGSGTRGAKREAEEEAIMALAEVMDLYSNTPSGWAGEFKSDAQDSLSAALLVTAGASPLIEPHRLAVLPLATLTHLLLDTIDRAFDSGKFLLSLRDSLSHTEDGRFKLTVNSQFQSEIHKLSASPVLQSMAPLSAVLVQVLSILADTRPTDAWPVLAGILRRLDTLTGTIESDWLQSPLAAISDDASIAPDSREAMTEMWTILKTLLFTTIRLVQAVLSVVAFVAQPLATSYSSSSSSAPEPTAFSLSLTALHIFSHLSFVLPQFGGVASTGDSSFPELKKAFYTALDVLSSDPDESTRFVHELCGSFTYLNGGERDTWPEHFMNAKKAYALACVEQLLPVLGDSVIRYDVFPLCEPHLDDPTYRETFESAHSVILAIFVAHAQRASEDKPTSREKNKGTSSRQLPFAEEFIPAYVQCLLDNSADGKLNTQQLCLAYRALVRSAGSFGGTLEIDIPSLSPGDAFAWYCIDRLIQTVQPQSNLTSGSQPETASPTTSSTDQLHRRRLALVATVPSVSLVLLPRLLESVHGVITPLEHGERREELVKALFQEIATRVGDEEKEYAVRWWYDHRDQLLGRQNAADVETEEGKGKGKARELVARL